MNKYKWFAVLALAGLAGCKAPLYANVQSSTEIKSAQSPDQPVPDIHKMYLYVDVGLWGPVSLGAIYLTAPDFNDTFIRQAAACHVEAVSIFDERLNVLKSAHYILSVDDRNKLFKADHSKLVDYAPDAVLLIKNTSFTTAQQFARTTLTDYAYNVELDAYPANKPVWKATVDLHPGDKIENVGTPEEVLARDVVKKLAADGILKNCPQQQPVGQ